MLDQQRVDWQSRAQFFAIAARVIRNILVDHARSRLAEKRGAGAVKVTLDDALHVPGGPDWDVIAIDDALTALGRQDPQQGKIVELRFFGGLSVEETAEVLAISTATVKRDWAMAKSWIYLRLTAPA